jgi:hypothetical protein
MPEATVTSDITQAGDRLLDLPAELTLNREIVVQ